MCIKPKVGNKNIMTIEDIIYTSSISSYKMSPVFYSKPKVLQKSELNVAPASFFRLRNSPLKNTCLQNKE